MPTAYREALINPSKAIISDALPGFDPYICATKTGNLTTRPTTHRCKILCSELSCTRKHHHVLPLTCQRLLRAWSQLWNLQPHLIKKSDNVNCQHQDLNLWDYYCEAQALSVRLHGYSFSRPTSHPWSCMQTTQPIYQTPKSDRFTLSRDHCGGIIIPFGLSKSFGLRRRICLS